MSAFFQAFPPSLVNGVSDVWWVKKLTIHTGKAFCEYTVLQNYVANSPPFTYPLNPLH